MDIDGGRRQENVGGTRFFNNLAPRLRLSSGYVYAIGVLMASIIFSSNLSWMHSEKPNKVEGLIITDLNRDGIQGPEDLGVGNINVRAYRDLNNNHRIDAKDAFLDQTFTNASGLFSLELPYLNTAIIPANDFGAQVSWSEEHPFVFRFSKGEIDYIQNIKSIWLEVKSKDIYSTFASTNIQIAGAGRKLVRWDHKPWKEGGIYTSPNLKNLISPFFIHSNDSLELSLSLQLSEGDAPREVLAGVKLKIIYENDKNPFLIVYETGYDSVGVASYKMHELSSLPKEKLMLSYENPPTNCLLATKKGSYIQYNRFSANSFWLSAKSPRTRSLNQSLIADPVSGKWMLFRNGRLKMLDAKKSVLAEQALPLPFCLDEKNCITAVAYHPLKDEIWLLDKEFAVWSLGMIREGNQMTFAYPKFVSDWGERIHRIPGEIIRMGIHLEDNSVYFLTRQEDKSIHLNHISQDGGKIKPLGPLFYGGKALEDITGFELRPNGEIWVMHVDDESNTQQIFSVDPSFQLLRMVSSFSIDEKPSSCACQFPAPYKITTKVFDDKNLSKAIDSGERLLRNVRIQAIAPHASTVVPQELQADESGNYTYRTYRKGTTELRVFEESLPEGLQSTGGNAQLIAHQNEVPGLHFEGSNFPVSHISNNPAIEWAGIRGELLEGGIQLEWATSKEDDTRFFEILRSEDGIHYTSVGGVQPCGNTQEMKEYQYKDYLIDDIETSIIAYRIKMKGGLGKTSYSPVAKIVISEPTEGLDLKVWVHPSNESVRLSYQVLRPGPAELRILNLTGTVLMSMPVNLSQNGAEKNISVKSWSKGMYYTQLRNGKNSIMRRWVLK